MDGGRTFVLILDQGEEAFAAVTDFANNKAISAASVAAIGAFENAKVGWFDLAAKRYDPISVYEQCEVLSLLGDIAQGDDGRASLHLHAVLGLRDGSVRGGHFLSGNVRPTLEVTIIETASSQEASGSGNRTDRYLILVYPRGAGLASTECKLMFVKAREDRFATVVTSTPCTARAFELVSGSEFECDDENFDLRL